MMDYTFANKQIDEAGGIMDVPQGFGVSLNEISQTAKSRWLSVPELEYLLSPESTVLNISSQPPSKPPSSGTVLLYDRNVTRNYKMDGYNWVKKRNSKKVREDRVKLRVHEQSRVCGLYVHCENIPTLHRRAYFLLDPKTGTAKTPVIQQPQPQKMELHEGGMLEDSCSLILLHYLDSRDIKPNSTDEKLGRSTLRSCAPRCENSKVEALSHQLEPENPLMDLRSAISKYRNKLNQVKREHLETNKRRLQLYHQGLQRTKENDTVLTKQFLDERNIPTSYMIGQSSPSSHLGVPQVHDPFLKNGHVFPLASLLLQMKDIIYRREQTLARQEETVDMESSDSITSRLSSLNQQVDISSSNSASEVFKTKVKDKSFSLDEIKEVAKTRWLKVPELEYLLNRETSALALSTEPPSSPPSSGTLILYDRNFTKNYKMDGYQWVKRRNSPKVREDHVKLRYEGESRVGGLYVHCENIPTFRRRAYYLLDPKTRTALMPVIQQKTQLKGTDSSIKANEELCSLILLHYLDAKDIDGENLKDTNETSIGETQKDESSITRGKNGRKRKMID